jgi:hypothetical protein
LVGLLTIFRPASNLYFNLITLAAHRPPQPIMRTLPHLHDGPRIIANRLYHLVGHGIHTGSEGHAMVSFFVLFGLWAYLLLRGRSGEDAQGLRVFLRNNSWCVFAVIAFVLFPLLFKASITLGGDSNHTGIDEFFLLLALTTSYVQVASPRSARRTNPAIHLMAFALVLVFSYRSIHLMKVAERAEMSTTSEAATFALSHPGVAYFPMNPLSTYFAEHHFYTMDHSIEDREIAKYPPSQEQYLSGLPNGVTIIAIDPDDIKVGEVSEALSRYLASGWVRADGPDLPHFAVYRRKPALGVS